MIDATILHIAVTAHCVSPVYINGTPFHSTPVDECPPPSYNIFRLDSFLQGGQTISKMFHGGGGRNNIFIMGAIYPLTPQRAEVCKNK